jgi:hypothetical protein
MKREQFIKNLEITNAYELKDNGDVYKITLDKLVYYPQGGGHIFDSWKELFNHKANTKTLGELVDELTEYDTEFIYHISVEVIDENGDIKES